MLRNIKRWGIFNSRLRFSGQIRYCSINPQTASCDHFLAPLLFTHSLIIRKTFVSYLGDFTSEHDWRFLPFFVLFMCYDDGLPLFFLEKKRNNHDRWTKERDLPSIISLQFVLFVSSK